ncbi:MAG: hypothetical protein EKK45_00805 [Curvibacter sp.]|nr:MAG: hypothetical protein EKK45_00805 [Curvibacter sp.]
MTRPLTFAQQALAHTGLVILSARFAIEQRPDLWADGLACAAEFGQAMARNSFANLPGIRFKAALDDQSTPVIVVARSADQLAARIEWLTGRKVISLEATVSPPQAVVAPPAPSAPPEDRHHGVVTRESSVTCSDCSAFTAGHSCSSAVQSGTEHPAANVPRRCLAFAPHWDAVDKRCGAERWPELVARPVKGGRNAPARRA